MRVLLAPEPFAGTLTASQAAAALAEGWRSTAPGDDLASLPLCDGGPGLVDAVSASLGGDLVPVQTLGPDGDERPATLLVTPGGGQDGPAPAPSTVWVEADQAVGAALGGAPMTATSAGAGLLVAEALLVAEQRGAARVVVGLGPSAVADGGVGALYAALERLGEPGPAGLARRLAARQVVLATARDMPLLGLNGLAASLVGPEHARGPARLDPATAQRREHELGGWSADLLDRLGLPAFGSGRVSATAGSGAGGGTAFVLLALGATRLPGPEVVASAAGLGPAAAAADLVVTGEGRLGWRSLRGSVLVAVSRSALAGGVPCVAVAGQVEVGRRELLALGVEAAYPVAEDPAGLRAAIADPAGTLAARTARVARTWSPRP